MIGQKKTDDSLLKRCNTFLAVEKFLTLVECTGSEQVFVCLTYVHLLVNFCKQV